MLLTKSCQELFLVFVFALRVEVSKDECNDKSNSGVDVSTIKVIALIQQVGKEGTWAEGGSKSWRKERVREGEILRKKRC